MTDNDRAKPPGGKKEMNNMPAPEKEKKAEETTGPDTAGSALRELLALPLDSVDFELNTITLSVPAEIMAKGFNCGTVLVNLSDVQRKR